MPDVRQEMLSLLSGYWFCQSLYTLAKLEIPEQLENAPKSSAELASVCQCNPEHLHRFLNAMVQVGLLSADGQGTYRNTDHSRLLCGNTPGTLKWHALFGGDPLHWRAWGELYNCIKSGKSGTELAIGKDFYTALSQQPRTQQAFAALMEQGSNNNLELANAMALAAGSTVVDLGGGNGALLSALQKYEPSLKGILYELSNTRAASNATKSPAKYSPQYQTQQGDLLDAVPAGGDYYILKFVLHNWDDQRAARILSNCAKAMHAEAEIIIIELLLPDPCVRKASAINNDYALQHDINMMVLTGGRERSLAEYDLLLKGSGLQRNEIAQLASGISVIRAALTQEKTTEKQ